MTYGDGDPKQWGLGMDASSSADAVEETHKAVRDVLLAFESMTPPAGAPADSFNTLRGQAQIARRRLEDLDTDVQTLRNAASPRGAQTQVVSANGVPSIHIHLHVNLSTNGVG